MGLGPLVPLVLIALGASALFGLDRLARWMQRRGWIDLSTDRVHRGSGRAMLGLQEFVEPGVEHVLVVEDSGTTVAPDRSDEGGGAGRDEFLDDLSTSLSFTPIDPEEVRRHLASACRAGLDWRSMFDEAIRRELAARPYRAPSLPPIGRVAPRDG